MLLPECHFSQLPTPPSPAHPALTCPPRPHLPTPISANNTNGVPQVTTCEFTLSWGVGGTVGWLLRGFRGTDPSAPKVTDLMTAKPKLFYAQE